MRSVAERRTVGVTLTQVGRELDVRPDQLRRWTQESGRGRAAGSAIPGESMEQENRRLRREVAVLRQEQAFAKKVAADSTGRCNTFGKYSRWRAEAESFPRTRVELLGDPV